MENKLIKQNLHHFKKVHSTRVYYDKVYYKITEDEIRNKILAGMLKAEDCDNNNIFKFLSLLKQVQLKDMTIYLLITVEEWRTAVKRAKKQSTSSIFS